MKFTEKIRLIMLNLFFPPRCAFCGRILKINTGFNVCGDCIKTLPYAEGKLCEKCGCAIDAVYGDNICYNCRHTKRYFDKCVAPFFYKDNARRAVLDFKFHNRTANVLVYAKYMAAYLGFFDKIDYITFVPMTAKRERKRGYNQARLLAEEIGKRENISVLPMLKKIKETGRQSRLKREERINNIKGSFVSLNLSSVKNASILLIDDVLTTGATANECAKMLKKAGAERVFVLTLATSNFKRF